MNAVNFSSGYTTTTTPSTYQKSQATQQNRLNTPGNHPQFGFEPCSMSCCLGGCGVVVGGGLLLAFGGRIFRGIRGLVRKISGGLKNQVN